MVLPLYTSLQTFSFNSSSFTPILNELIMNYRHCQNTDTVLCSYTVRSSSFIHFLYWFSNHSHRKLSQGERGGASQRGYQSNPQRQKTHSHIHTDNYDPYLTWHTHTWSTRDRKNMETPSERPELTRNLLLANKHPNTETSLGLFSKHTQQLLSVKFESGSL